MTPTVRRTGSLRRRLAAVVAGVVALVVVLVAVLTGFVVTVQLHSTLDTSLSREATRVQRLAQANPDTVSDLSGDCRYAVEPACARLIASDATVGTGSGPLAVTSAARAVADGTQDRALYTADGVRVVVLPTRPDGAVMVGLPTRQTDVAVSRTWIALGVAGAVGIVLAAVAGYVVATVGLRPVQRLDRAVRRVRDTADPHARVGIRRNDELGRLSGAFDEMLAELAAASDSQRDFAADASHELRTPLTTLRTNLQLLGGDRPIDDATRESLRAAVTQELAAMQATIDDLAELARGDRSLAGLARVDVVAAAHDAATVAARRWGVPIDVDAPEAPVLVSVPDGRLPRLFDVLLDNAGKYGAGGPVSVSVGAVDDEVVVRITDRGIGIPPADRARVFDRFHRAPSARRLPGSGLGLAIAAQVVAGAHGTIRLEPGPGDVGTAVTVVLPRA
ncbi:HAMP domain-containing histidine kinase [Curtobacterium flaccumfaciens pv. oortii]|uniref:HAMP domain-containing sensor histidine kinase n=1 Tax=Curtobacterium flaccumfaciens TaxID=2035 RepID=UPI001BDE41FA|nr:HAMP domain-containing sensor histidine kinase [Curtobacterium flaccumfaciens]MBT1623314.1 HAMP domain-containing histidine kinase [Curtobacterium flaccumfaciens pv. oortii]